jgi:hypothetical protein
MYSDGYGLRRVSAALLLIGVVACFAAGCSDITPEPNDTGGGVLESPTHEADQMRQMEEQQQENQRMGGGGGGGARR